MPLTLFDYSDRELLHVVLDATDLKTGYALTKDIADALGLGNDDDGTRCVGSRMAWLRRYGAVEKHSNKSAWVVTTIGQELINGELTERQRHLIEDAEQSNLLMMTRAMTRRYRSSATTAAHLVRREWRRGTR